MAAVRWIVGVVVLAVAGLASLSAAQPVGAVPGIPASVSPWEGGYLFGSWPHGGYSDASNRCKICHAVHGARVGGEALIKYKRDEACIYCHFTHFSVPHPYGNNAALYTTEYENNHAATHQGTAYRGCLSCHSIHGANVLVSPVEGITASMMVRNDPGGTLAGGTGAVAAPATTLTEFCRDCHDKTGRADGTGTCVTCHDTVQMGVSDFPERDQVSHVMTATLTGADGITQGAVAGSTTCRSCHKSAATFAAGNSFPHLTAGADFLTDGHTSTSPLDRVCLECHVWNGGASGVGVTY
ncbi:MAG: cytochrome c3 family protein [Thermoleophilia bacterium]